MYFRVFNPNLAPFVGFIIMMSSHVTQQLSDVGEVVPELESLQQNFLIPNVHRDDAYRLAPARRYLIIAPRVVRPDMEYRIQVTVTEMGTSRLTIRAIMSQDLDQYATGVTVFYQTGSKLLTLKVPEGLVNGTHILTVEGITGSNTAYPTFKEYRYLNFSSKHVSIFVQTDRPVYFPPNIIRYRILGFMPDLTAATGSMAVFLKDSKGHIVVRSLNQQLNFGQFEGEFTIEYPVNVGTWHIMVEAFGHTYEHPFEMIWYWFWRYEVNMTAPLTIMDTDPVYKASIYGEHMSKKEASGNASARLSCQKDNGDFLPGSIEIDLAYVKGVRHFEVPMPDILRMWGEYLEGHTLHLEGWMHDWEFEETRNGTAKTKMYTDRAVIKRLGNAFTTFHPGKPFTAYFAISKSDGTRYDYFRDRWVHIEVIREGPDGGSYTEQAVIPDDSVVRHTVTPAITDEKIYIVVRHRNSSTSDFVEAYRYFSPNGYYIAVTTSTEKPTTNRYIIFTVRTNFFATEFNYILMSKGEILLANTISMYSQQTTFAVSLSRQMIPHARIIVYYVIKDFVIMDGINFHVTDSILTTGSLWLNRGKDFTFHTLEFIGRAPVGSFMSLNGHHYEWARRGADTFLTKEKVIRDLLTYSKDETSPYHHIWFRNDTRWDEDVFFPSESLGMEGNSTLAGAGLHVCTDLKLSFAHGDYPCNSTLGLVQCLDGSCIELNQKCDGVLDCSDGYDEAGCPELNPPKPRPHEALSLSPFGPYFEEVTWAFQTHYVKPNLGGQVEVTLHPPEVKDIYMFHAFFIHPDVGLIIADETISHNLTRWFFMRCEGPESVRRGEQFGVRCALFNKWPQYIEVMMALHGGHNYRFINIEEHGIVSSFSPRLTAGDVHVMVSLFPGEERYVYWPIQTITVRDEVEVTISAWSIVDKDQETISLPVHYDGCKNDEHTVFLIDLINRPSVFTPYLDTGVPAEWYIPGQRDHLYIPGSPIATVSVWGGVASSGFQDEPFTAENVASLPHDSLEGYTFDFAFNLLVLQYMRDLNKLDEPTKQTVLKLMESQLMRFYAYMDDDGAFRMFRRADDTCLWCTSSVLYHLHEFFTTEWAEDVFIPLNVLNKIALWLVRQQDEDGAFIETTGIIYNRHFLPNSTTEDGVNHTWHIPTTAHATITLAKAVRLTDLAKAAAARAVDLGATYLATKVVDITDPFQMAITAYALEMSGHAMKDDAYHKLKTMRREDYTIYWSPVEIPPNEVDIVDNKPIVRPRSDFVTLGNAAMATSYALMLYLNHGEFEASRPIVNWLVEQRMDNFAVSACVDTLLVQEAVMKFAKQETNHQFYNMKVTLTAPAIPDWKEVVYINSSNFPNFQQFEIPEIWGTIVGHSEGTGYAQFTAYSDYRVEKGYQVSKPDFPSIAWYIRDITYAGRNGSIMTFDLCLSWQRPDLGEYSGMVVLFMNTPAGYIVERDEIERIYAHNTANIKRVLQRASTLLIFFEKVPIEGICWQITFRRWFPVSNMTVSHFLGIVETTETALYNFTGYNTYTLFHLHACQVCSSFQCPYCPWYNSATMRMPSLLSLMLSLCFPCVVRLMKQILYRD